MADTTNSNPDGANVDPVEAIADVLNEEFNDGVQDEEVEEGEGEQGEYEEGDDDEGESAEGSSWSQALGIDDSQVVVDDDGNLRGINVKVDGNVYTVPVKDLVAGYQLNKHVTQKSQMLADERRQFEAIRDEVSDIFLKKLQTVDKLTEQLKQNLLGDFQRIDWNKLRVERPDEYAATVTDFQMRKNQIDALMAAIQQEGAQFNNALEGRDDQRYKAYLREQYEVLVSRNPEWNDTSKMREAMIELGQKASEVYGISPEEFNSLADARHFEILRDAIAYRNGKTAVQKQLQKAPRMQNVKGGSLRKPMDKVTQLTLNARKAKGHKQIDLQTAAVAELLAGNSRR